MDSDRKESYLEGVPFRISPRYFPPRSVPGPFACAPLFPIDLLEEEYDFTLEKEVLESVIGDVPPQEETVPKAVAANATSEVITSLSPLKPESSEPPTTLNPSIAPTNFSTSSWQPCSILQPQSLSQSKTNENGPFLPAKYSSENINVLEFENDTSSPFDYMELQSINDLEELSNVFQAQDLSGSKPKVFTESDKSCVYTSCNTSLPSLNSSAETKEQTLTNFSKSVSFPLHQESLFLNSDNCHSSANTINCDLSNANTLDCRNMNGYGQPTGSFQEGVHQNFYQAASEREMGSVVFTGKGSVSFSALAQVPQSVPGSSTAAAAVGYVNSPAHSSPQSMGAVPLRGSKSVTDLYRMPLLDGNSIPTSGRSHTPPPSIANKVFDVEKGLKKNASSENGSNSATSLPDPYFELKEEERQFVDSVTDMGFPRDLVARTVRHLGSDEKKVVEHLCEIQSLEELGYDSLEAEAALHLHDYNKDEAKKFLDLLLKFQDLGFEKTAIKKALVQNKNDMNKVFNTLLP